MEFNPLESALTKTAIADFHERYGRAPHRLVVAPGRVNVIGEHLDYNEGVVLPMAIERHLVVVAAPSPKPRARLWSGDLDEETLIPLDQEITRAGSWSDYIRGVLAGYAEGGAQLAGFDAIIRSNIPIGGGLSSSAALQVAVATLIEHMSGQKKDAIDRARLCQKAEHVFAGLPCGLMDQLTSILARPDHLLLLDCRSNTVEFVPVDKEFGAFVIIDTRVSHDLKEGAYAQRRDECHQAAKLACLTSLRDLTLAKLDSCRDRMPETIFRRARHVVTEIDRTVAAANAVRQGDARELGRLMYASHGSLSVDFEVSCKELDQVVDIARSLGKSNGVMGCRMTGGGFGGCAVALAQQNAVDSVSRTIAEQYAAHAGHQPAIFETQPQGGAEILSLDASLT